MNIELEDLLIHIGVEDTSNKGEVVAHLKEYLLNVDSHLVSRTGNLCNLLHAHLLGKINDVRDYKLHQKIGEGLAQCADSVQALKVALLGLSKLYEAYSQ